MRVPQKEGVLGDQRKLPEESGRFERGSGGKRKSSFHRR